MRCGAHVALTIGSLFSGIGGLELGLEAALPGSRVAWQVEIEDYPRAVLARRWPDADRSVRDVRLALRTYAAPSGEVFDAGRLGRVDLVCGGFPCQDLSIAGRGAGLAGERSGLWWQYWRIVRGLRPRFVVVENVAALLVRGLPVVLGSLAELGYDAEWCVFSAADVGAPHLRRRIAIVAHLPDANGAGRNEPEPAAGRGGAPVARDDGASWRVADAHSPRRERRRLPKPARAEDAGARCRSVADAHEDRRGGLAACRACSGVAPGGDAHGRGLAGWDRGPAQPGLGGAADGIPARVVARWERGVPRVAPSEPTTTPRLAALGNAVVPQWAYAVGLRVAELLTAATPTPP